MCAANFSDNFSQVKLRHNGQERTVPAEHLVLVKIAPDLTGGSAEE